MPTTLHALPHTPPLPHTLAMRRIREKTFQDSRFSYSRLMTYLWLDFKKRWNLSCWLLNHNYMQLLSRLHFARRFLNQNWIFFCSSFGNFLRYGRLFSSSVYLAIRAWDGWVLWRNLKEMMKDVILKWRHTWCHINCSLSIRAVVGLKPEPKAWAYFMIYVQKMPRP